VTEGRDLEKIFPLLHVAKLRKKKRLKKGFPLSWRGKSLKSRTFAVELSITGKK
jgi:hypothetical protein